MADEENKELLEAIKKLTEETDEARLQSLNERIEKLKAEEGVYKRIAETGKTIVGRAKEALDLREAELEQQKLLLKLGKDEAKMRSSAKRVSSASKDKAITTQKALLRSLWASQGSLPLSLASSL